MRSPYARRSIDHADPFVDKQYLVGRSGERRDVGIAAVVVEMHVRDVKEALQYLDCRRKPVVPDTMKLDNELVNVFEHRIRRQQERIPLCAFDIHFDDQTLPIISIACNLAGQRIELPSSKQSYSCTRTSNLRETSHPHWS